MKIDILSALQGIEDISVKEYVFAVIDVLRASSTILLLMEKGAKNITIVGTIEEALKLKKSGYILIGERGDRRLEGFHFDNSPYEISRYTWDTKRVVLTTSNGTRALIKLQNGYKVIVAGFRNIDAAADYLRQSKKPVGIVPIGNLGEPRLEDECCATALRERILYQEVGWDMIKDKILIDAKRKISERGSLYMNDIELSLMVNVTRIIPVMSADMFLTATYF